MPPPSSYSTEPIPLNHPETTRCLSETIQMLLCRVGGAFQLVVGSFPGCHHHHHTPRSPSLTILRQRAVSLKQSRCRFAGSCEITDAVGTLVKQIESVEKEFPQQHLPPSNSGTTPQKAYDALKCTAMHDILHCISDVQCSLLCSVVHTSHNLQSSTNNAVFMPSAGLPISVQSCAIQHNA